MGYTPQKIPSQLISLSTVFFKLQYLQYCISFQVYGIDFL